MSISIILAPIRTGKTTMAVRMAHKFWKQHPNSPVYTNIPDLAGAYFVSFDEFDTYRVWHKDTDYALYLLDEAGLEINNREFKSFKPSSRQWVALSGHEKTDLVVFSQACDFDLTLRVKATDLYTLKRFGPWTYCRRWFKKEDTDIESGWPRWIWQKSPFPVVLSTIIYRPHWYKYFNSYWSLFDNLPDVPESRLIGSNQEGSSTGTCSSYLMTTRERARSAPRVFS